MTCWQAMRVRWMFESSSTLAENSDIGLFWWEENFSLSYIGLRVFGPK